MKRGLLTLLMLLIWITPCRATEEAQEPLLFPAEAYSQVIVPETLAQVQAVIGAKDEVREIYPLQMKVVTSPGGSICWAYEVAIVVRMEHGANGVRAVEENIYTAFFIYDPVLHKIIYVQHIGSFFDKAWYELEV